MGFERLELYLECFQGGEHFCFLAGACCFLDAGEEAKECREVVEGGCEGGFEGCGSGGGGGVVEGEEAEGEGGEVEGHFGVFGLFYWRM